ncbi:hypothetical protein [Paenibacillus apiarius]|uniref:Phage protein n=1 Tax=Paenibacillus apiarius TaxID=46240 RepID=A0ABT4DQV7_9BACL|nr:hypothetical protein [Paenibacillus apiarius]MCY9513324.1 hypothetical protein [Paenibacillus apiarius]MCY9519704.1 hypothetical protein [Paenibacillus apiarius]MCY9553240.1 hypothetical protein [Paenibacillus apiarius]MCY9557090.1 hypothetical protein [Paenibacillus apiarius]MCY9682169.1 hypothetical protein [Paenibacillus apiarius]
MVYVLINKKNEVVRVSDEKIENNNPHLEQIRMWGPVPGDELNYYIVVSSFTEPDEDGYRKALGYNSTNMTATVLRMLNSIYTLEAKVAALEAKINPPEPEVEEREPEVEGKIEPEPIK